MKKVELLLDDREYALLKNLNTAKAAVEICKIYFRRQNPSVVFPPSPNKADLHVQFPNASGFDIEVKGTGEPGLAWNQLKVSGKPSHDMLKQGMPLFRVCSIGSRKAIIFILKYGEDFEMIPEPRWTIRPTKSAR